MTWTKKQFGPGPQPVYNEWLNSFLAQVESNIEVTRSFGSGVVLGCEVAFEAGTVVEETPGVWVAQEPTINVAEGIVLTDGYYAEIAAKTWTMSGAPGTGKWTSSVDDEEQVDCSAEPNVWIYVDSEGIVRLRDSSSNAWPRTIEGFAAARDLPVLAVGRLDAVPKTAHSENYYIWHQSHDIRHFVREKPNSGYLVVGDVATGADFETLQGALDYLNACYEPTDNENEVPLRILVTEDQVVTKPIAITFHGITIEGVRKPGADSDEDLVTISWDYSDGDGVLIDAQRMPFLTLRNLRFLRTDGAQARCCIDAPGDAFELEGCVFGDPADETRMDVAVYVWNYNLYSASVHKNLAHGLGQSFVYCHEGSGLVGSTISDNYISIDTTLADGTALNEIPFAVDTYHFTETNHEPSNNVVMGNIIDGCWGGIRVSDLCRVSSNAIGNVIFRGVEVTGGAEYSSVPFDNVEYPAWLTGWYGLTGSTEVSDNHIEMGPYEDLSLWRAGIHLRLPSCHVENNTIVAGNDPASGIIDLPCDPFVRDVAIAFYYLGLCPGRHTIVGNSIVMNPVDDSGNIDYVVTTREGFGIALMTTENRVADNLISSARVGIFVTAYNAVANNVISPAAIGIAAWSHNAITANSIGWFPHLKRMEMLGIAGYSAMMIANNNSVDGNAIVCGANPPLGVVPQAIHVLNLPQLLFQGSAGHVFRYLWDPKFWGTVPIAAQKLYGKFAGGNIISNQRIVLFAQRSIMHLVNSAFARSAGDVWAYLVFIWIVADFNTQLALALLYWYILLYLWIAMLSSYYLVGGILLEGVQEGNIVNSTQIWHGITGIVARSGPAIIDGCSIIRPMAVGVELMFAPDSKVSGCTIKTPGRLGGRLFGTPLRIGRMSPNSVVNDCSIAQAGFANPTENWVQQQQLKAHLPKDIMFQPPAVILEADHVSVNDCTILNWGNMGILWNGNFGACGGCMFATTSDINLRNLKYEKNYYPAIYFRKRLPRNMTEIPEEFIFPNAGTQGNLVWGAQMAFCQPHHTVAETSPIYYANTELLTYNDKRQPELFSGTKRLSNIVHLDSCYYIFLDPYAAQ